MSNEKPILKWFLKRSEQVRNISPWLCGFGVVNDQYKACRPSQVILSENLVGNAMNFLINKYLNPFDGSVDPNYLFKLSSGEPVPNDLASNILNIHNEGLMVADDFINKRINSNKLSFHRAISRNETLRRN